MRAKRTGKQSLYHAALVGAVAGTVGALVMSKTSAVWRKVIGLPSHSGPELARLEARQYVDGSGQEMDSITATADLIDGRLLNHELSPRGKGMLAAGVHYAVGAAFGAVYSVLAEKAPAVRTAAGVPFGMVEAFAGESVTTPLLGLIPGPKAYSVREHLHSLADHAVFGATVDVTRRGLMKVWR